jgi:hypothetical protein
MPTRIAEPEADGTAIVDVHADDRPPYGMITSQTCDIDEQRPVPREPFVQVCPAYRLPNDFSLGQLGNIQRDRVGHLMMLDAAALGEGNWVADFRIEVPLEKSLLVGRQPIEAFQTPDRYALLGERLAHRRSRPALADSVHEHVTDSIRQWRSGLSAKDLDYAWVAVERVLLSVQGDLLDPTAVQVVIATESEPLPSEGRELWDGWWDSARQGAERARLNLVGNRFTTLRDLSAAEFMECVPLDMTYLAD